MNAKLLSTVDEIVSAPAPEKTRKALPMALCVIAAFADDTTAYDNECLSVYAKECKKLIKRPIFKAYCRKCGVETGLRPEITVQLTQDQQDVLLENAASIVVRSEESKKILALKFAFRVLEKMTLLDVHDLAAIRPNTERSIAG